MARTLPELIDQTDPAWPLVQRWIADGRNTVEVLPAERRQAEHTLLQLQVTTRSPLGAIALETGGLLVDHGWIRVLGSGNERIAGDLLAWNGLGNASPLAHIDGALIVGHDVLGGFFALNGGRFAGNKGSVYYLAPDTLDWEDLGRTYTDWIRWTCAGDLGLFYQGLRWQRWERDVDGLSGMSIYPPLWTKGPAAPDRSRRKVEMPELWRLHTAK